MKLPFGYISEFCTRGGRLKRSSNDSCESIKPDVAIVTDVCHDRTPMIDKIKQGDTKCSNGPVLTYGPAVQNSC